MGFPYVSQESHTGDRGLPGDFRPDGSLDTLFRNSPVGGQAASDPGP